MATGGARADGKAPARSVVTAAPDADVAASTAQRDELPDTSPVRDRSGPCLHTLLIPNSGVAADPSGRSDTLRWIRSTSLLKQVHLSPSHPPPVTVA